MLSFPTTEYAAIPKPRNMRIVLGSSIWSRYPQYTYAPAATNDVFHMRPSDSLYRAGNHEKTEKRDENTDATHDHRRAFARLILRIHNDALHPHLEIQHDVRPQSLEPPDDDKEKTDECLFIHN